MTPTSPLADSLSRPAATVPFTIRLRGLLLLIAGLLVLGFALLSLWSELAVAGPRLQMRNWADEPQQLNPASLRAMQQRLARVVGLNPNNADYLADYSRIMQWQSTRLPAWDAAAIPVREKAMGALQRALVLRPSWGYGWAELAQLQVLNRALDNRTMAALERAVVLEPWAPGTQLKVLETGIALWPDLDAQGRRRVSETLRRGLRHQLDMSSLVRLAKRYEWLEQLRGHLRSPEQQRLFEFQLARVER